MLLHQKYLISIEQTKASSTMSNVGARQNRTERVTVLLP